ncbi:MAG TPA: ATP-binding protein [Myxococcales bacterium]|nr:ATP-binding protein [Myxococcales bacterium]
MTPGELVAQLPLAAFVSEGDRITAVNQRLVELVGYEAGEILEGSITQFLPEDERERIWRRHRARLSGQKEPPDYLVRLLHSNGQTVASRVRVSFFPAAGPEALLCLLTDERERDRTTQLIQGFVDAATAAVRQTTQAEILRVAREQVEALGLSVTTWIVDGDRLHIVDTGKAGPFVEVVRARWPEGAPASIFPGPPNVGTHIFIDDLPGVRARILGEPRAKFESGAPQGMVTTVPVPGGNSLIFSCSGDRLDESVASAFGLLGKQLGAALEGALRLEEANQRTAELSLLLELGREVVGALDEDEVVSKAARTAALSLRCDCAYVLLPDAHNTVLRVAAREDPAPSPGLEVGSEFPLSVDSLSALAYRHCAPYTSSDGLRTSVTDPHGKRTTMAVPLLSHGQALGVLTLADNAGREFDTQDIRLATHAAQLVASALLNARLYAAQRTRAKEMAFLSDFALQLSGSLERKPLLELAGTALTRLLGGESWLSFAPDPRLHALRFEDKTPSDLRAASETAFRERKLVELEGAVVLPLLARDEALGVLIICKPRRYQADEANQALAVAGAVALALLSARLFEDLRHSYAALERTQAELIDRERMAALGELSASIAHEVRNPLGVIFNSVGTLQRLLRPQGDVALLLDIVGEEADRLNRMVGDLLDYSRPVQPALEPLSLEPLVKEAISGARRQIGPAAELVQVEVHIAKSAATLRADARLLRQALVNLLLNAFQSMPRGGLLEVRATNAMLEQTACAEISIRDSGPGIPPEALSRIFQPFFTTKATGTGLGLAVVRRIVEGHGGAVAVGRPASGAEFLVRLPLSR